MAITILSKRRARPPASVTVTPLASRSTATTSVSLMVSWSAATTARTYTPLPPVTVFQAGACLTVSMPWFAKKRTR